MNSSSCFPDPFAALAQCSGPWQELSTEHGAPTEDALPPDVQLSQLSADSEDNTLVSSADPAACDFLLVALAFQEQKNSLPTGLELQLDSPVVAAAAGAISGKALAVGEQQPKPSNCKAATTAQ